MDNNSVNHVPGIKCKGCPKLHNFISMVLVGEGFILKVYLEGDTGGEYIYINQNQIDFSLPGRGVFPFVGFLEEFFCGVEGVLGDAGTAYHHGKLVQAFIILEGFDVTYGAVIGAFLADIVVGVGEGGNLGEMGNTGDLVAAGEVPEFPADDLAATPAYPDIYLVENKHRNRIRLRQGALYRQEETRRFTGGGYFIQRFFGLAGICRSEENNVINHAGIFTHGFESGQVRVNIRNPKPLHMPVASLRHPVTYSRLRRIPSGVTRSGFISSVAP